MEDEKEELKHKNRELRKELYETLIILIKEAHDGVVAATSELEPGKKVEFGIRDKATLEFLVYRITRILDEYTERKAKKQLNIEKFVFQSFAVIFKDLAQKYHIFVDGNKRTSYLIIKLLLLIVGYHLKVEYYKEALSFILDVASGKKTDKEIEQWLTKHSSKIREPDPRNYIEKWISEMKVKEED